MASKLKIRVVALREMLEARKAIEAGNFHDGAGRLAEFCGRNYTMRAENGELWGDVKVAAALLLNLAAGDAKGAQRIIGNLWRKVFPYLTEETAKGTK